jgi:general secretion pathway protein M
MNLSATLRKSLLNSPIVAATAYGALVIVLLTIMISSLGGLLSQRSSVASTAAMLEQLEGRKAPAAGARSGEGGAIPSGSPFLEGKTVTVAGAALLQRVAAAVTKAGGNVLSSQLDVQGEHAKAGFVSMVANCELEQSALQSLLYDLEAGMPFLFIDQLDIQTPTGTGDSKLRFLLGVSGQWQGAK